MAIDKLVDSSQLDANLTLIANAIRTKNGTSVNLSFPNDFITAINAISGGGGGLETVTIFSSQTVTATDTDTSGYVIYLDSITENLVADTNYIVTMDGTLYLCYAHTVYDSIYAGDFEVVWGTPANAIYPFAIGSYANNRTQWMVADNSPHTVKIERVVSMSGSGNVTYETIVPTTTVSATAGDWMRLTSGNTPTLIDGEYYSYFINGVEYVATATTGNNTIYLSNILWDWDTANGYAIGFDTTYGGIWFNSKMAGTYTVKVDKITFSEGGSGGSSATLITKNIIANGNYNASSDSADGYSSVSVSVPNAITITEVANTTGTTVVVTGTVANDDSAYQIVTGTVEGNGTNILQIPCEFEPDLIRIHGDLSADVANKGIVSMTIIKDMDIYTGYDSSTSESRTDFAAIQNITGYNESDTSTIHATYSNNTLTIDTVQNSSTVKWPSEITYEYKLIKFSSSTPSVTQHTIHFVFTDETTTDIPLYYTDTFTASAITTTTPTTYNNKTVETASLDGVVWYTRPQYEVLFNGSVTFGGEITESTPYYSIYISELGNLYPTEGESYRITIDNTVYNCTACVSDGDINVGNPKYSYGIDDGSDVPFVFYNGGYGGWNGQTELSPTEHTVKIERLTTTQQ